MWSYRRWLARFRTKNLSHKRHPKLKTLLEDEKWLEFYNETTFRGQLQGQLAKQIAVDLAAFFHYFHVLRNVREKGNDSHMHRWWSTNRSTSTHTQL